MNYFVKSATWQLLWLHAWRWTFNQAGLSRNSWKKEQFVSLNADVSAKKCLAWENGIKMRIKSKRKSAYRLQNSHVTSHQGNKQKVMECSNAISSNQRQILFLCGNWQDIFGKYAAWFGLFLESFVGTRPLCLSPSLLSPTTWKQVKDPLESTSEFSHLPLSFWWIWAHTQKPTCISFPAVIDIPLVPPRRYWWWAQAVQRYINADRYLAETHLIEIEEITCVCHSALLNGQNTSSWLLGFSPSLLCYGDI